VARIELVRSGGFAGLSLRAAVDTAAPDDPDAAWFARALEGLDLSGLAAGDDAGDDPAVDGPGTPPPGPGQPDRFHYDLAVDSDDGRQELSFGETAVPEALRPVVDRLVQRARTGRDRTGPNG
jgi:emfourin